jgi:hypothetical protein
MNCTVQSSMRLHAILSQTNVFHTNAPYCLSSTSLAFSQFSPNILSCVFPSVFRLIFFRHFFSNCKHQTSNPSYPSPFRRKEQITKHLTNVSLLNILLLQLFHIHVLPSSLSSSTRSSTPATGTYLTYRLFFCSFYKI